MLISGIVILRWGALLLGDHNELMYYWMEMLGLKRITQYFDSRRKVAATVICVLKQDSYSFGREGSTKLAGVTFAKNLGIIARDDLGEIAFIMSEMLKSFIGED